MPHICHIKTWISFGNTIVFFSVIFATETLVHPKAIRVGGFNRDRVTLRVLLWRVRKTAAQTHLAHEFAANNDASNTW